MIRSDTHSRVGTITIDRPGKLNALTTEMLGQLDVEVSRLVESRVAVIVVRSSSKHFSAGADLGEWAEPTANEAASMSSVGERAFARLASAPMPSVAVIEGVAAGGGLELALACDLRLASIEARLGLPEARLANLPAYGGIPRLVEIVGVSRARELLFTAELIDGKRAAELGLVNWIAEPEETWDLADRVIQQIAGADAASVSLAKSLTGGTPIDGLLSRITSQTEASKGRKRSFLSRQETHRKKD